MLNSEGNLGSDLPSDLHRQQICRDFHAQVDWYMIAQKWICMGYPSCCSQVQTGQGREAPNWAASTGSTWATGHAWKEAYFISSRFFFWSYISIKLELRCWRVTRNLILRGNPCFARNTCNPAMPLGAPNCASTCTRWYMWTYMNCLCWTCWQVKQFEVWHVSHNLQMKCNFWETHPCPLNISTRL